MSLIDKVRQTVADTLNLPVEQLSEESSSDNVSAWDSLAQVNLMMALEQTFHIEIDIDDFLNLTSIARISDYLEDQGIDGG